MFVLIVEFSKEVKDLNFGKCVAASLSYNKQFDTKHSYLTIIFKSDLDKYVIVTLTLTVLFLLILPKLLVIFG